MDLTNFEKAMTEIKEIRALIHKFESTTISEMDLPQNERARMDDQIDKALASTMDMICVIADAVGNRFINEFMQKED